MAQDMHDKLLGQWHVCLCLYVCVGKSLHVVVFWYAFGIVEGGLLLAALRRG